jgi:hypothetical protein
MGTFSILHTCCSNFVYIASYPISSFAVREDKFIGFFAAFIEARFWFNTSAVQNFLEIVKKSNKNAIKPPFSRDFLIEILFQSLA